MSNVFTHGRLGDPKSLNYGPGLVFAFAEQDSEQVLVERLDPLETTTTRVVKMNCQAYNDTCSSSVVVLLRGAPVGAG